jgi:hypothetical protein
VGRIEADNIASAECCRIVLAMSTAIPAITVLDEFGEEVQNRKESTLPGLALKPWSEFYVDLPLPFRRSDTLAREEYEKLLKLCTCC